MAAEDGPAPDHLSYFRRAAETARRFGFFALVRGAEARAPKLPRVGRSRHPGQNIADMGHASTLNFPGSTIDAVEFTKGGRPRVRGYFLGLTGPMGPLPLQLTEFANFERRYAKAQPFGRFLDLLTDRMLQFFYRAWADSQPAAQADRPDDDRFAYYLAQLSGAREGAAADSGFPIEARLHYAGLFASRRSAAVIQDGLSHLLGMPVRVVEFVPRWRDIEASDRSRLGASGGFNSLGVDTVIGRRVRVVDDAFRVVVRAANMADYQSFLPGGARFEAAQDALDALAPSHLEWEIEIEIPQAAPKGLRLDGQSRLGWTGWVQPQANAVIRADARLRRRPRVKAA
ncbi:MAG TPA: type VI secretion system baseplate subunit TssG [Caulobacteraceae bacterium]|nr:type VI secretion system baseplate subunit TssG [Caulobacteraceae bacterium]